MSSEECTVKGREGGRGQPLPGGPGEGRGRGRDCAVCGEPAWAAAAAEMVGEGARRDWDVPCSSNYAAQCAQA
eukprot:4857833-Prymnesium_polylepis.1